MTAVPAAIVSSFAFGAIALAIRAGLARTPDAAAAAVAITATAALPAIVVALAGRDPVPWPHLVPLLVGGAIAPGMTQGVFARAVRWAGPSRATIASQAAPLFSVLIATIVLHERLTAGAVAGTMVIVLGGAFLVWERTRSAERVERGIALGVLCALLFAARDNTLRYAVRGGDTPPTVGAAVSLCAAAAVSLLLFLGGGGATRRRLASAWRAFVPAGLLLWLAVEALLHALAHGRIALVSPLIATQSLWTVALSVVFFSRAFEAVGWRLVGSAVLIGLGSALVAISR